MTIKLSGRSWLVLRALVKSSLHSAGPSTGRNRGVRNGLLPLGSLQSRVTLAENPEETAQVLDYLTRLVCDDCLRHRRLARGHWSMYQWTPEIASARRACNRARRRFQRTSADRVVLYQEWKDCRRELRHLIRSSKKRC